MPTPRPTHCGGPRRSDCGRLPRLARLVILSLLEPGYCGKPASDAVAAVAVQRGIFHRAPWINADPGNAGGGELTPQPGSQIQTRGALPGTAGAAGQVCFHVGLHLDGYLVALPARR